jgi:hypothetical protein
MKIKKFIVDTFALNIFIIFVAFFVEVIFSGIGFFVFLKGRLIMIIPNTLTVVPYAKTRVFFDKKLTFIKNVLLKNIVRDTSVFILYRVPLVFVVLAILNVPFNKIITACLISTLISGFTGRPYGIFLDKIRKIFKTF